VSNLTNGSVVVTVGTVSKLPSDGTITALAVGTIGGKAASGAAAVANPVQIAGTDGGGTIYSPFVTTGGILKVVDTAGTIATGSLTDVAKLYTGTINVGTFVMPTGTVTTIVAGTQNTLGTVGAVNSIVAGTQNTLGTVGVVNNIVTGTLAAVTTVTTVSNVTNGSINLLTGTLTRASNIGTLESGTVKLNSTPAGSTLLYSHTLGTAGAGAFWGTLVAPVGAGTFAYLSGLSIVVHSGTPEVAVTDNVAGSTGAGVFARGVFSPTGGIARDFAIPIRTVANGTLAYMINAGTASITVNYWVAP
jgi:hypothetical protein